MTKVVVLSLRGHDDYPDLAPDPVPPYGQDHPHPNGDTDEPLVEEEREVSGTRGRDDADA